MDAPEAIRQHAPYHAQLLEAVTELDWAPPALVQQDKYIDGLQVEAQRVTAAIRTLAATTKKERKEYEALRDSTARRLTAKFTGRREKFEAKASKEEREYVEAVEKEMQEKRQLEMLKGMISEAKGVRADIQDKVKRHEMTKADLAELYSKVFDGPTQAYPEDDHLEQQLQLAQGRYDDIQGCLNGESQALGLLQSASGALDTCHKSIREALDYSTWDIWGGGTLTDMMERNALSQAENMAKQTATYVQQAMLTSPNVQPIGQINIPHGSIMSDVIFDNVFTDVMFHDKIQTSERNVEAVKLNLAAELQSAKNRTGAVGADLSAAADALSRARSALDKFRREAFGRLSGSIPPLPGYDELHTGQRDVPSMPEGPSVGYTPPAGAPPGHPDAAPGSGTEVLQSGSQGAPSMPVGPIPSATYTPPLSGPPPSASYAPRSEPLPGPPPPPASQTWGSRNPYAAALATGRASGTPETETNS
ncbi:hypothetical protein B0H15DRAFT_834122 [Mycena belliarum]|uniref:Uncharacterized protein n=1 Tax=Mycena belliarum TaxID=1033014 RepID=A0AAD6U854_9AGAR|nr:hypothetical protein B0H15DRAFT_834122 [Mycena belliae]